MKEDMKDVIAKYGTFGCPWMVAFKVPKDDRPISTEEKRKNPLEATEFQNFFGVDRVEGLGYL